MERESVTSQASGEREAWLRRPEVGSPLGIRLLLWTLARGGRGAARGVIAVVAAYYTLRSADVRRDSGAYLQRVFGTATLRMVYRHVRTFAEVALDRVVLATPGAPGLSFTRDGTEHLLAQARSGRGAILLGAHIGSFEAMRAVVRRDELPIRMLVHRDNARKLAAALAQIDPGAEERLIEIDPANPTYIFKVQECVERGEMVAILADRVGLGDHAIEVPFLGAVARFPAGPFHIAAALGCPIFVVSGLYHRPSHYALRCRPFAMDLRVPRRERAAAVERAVRRFAAHLETLVRTAPYNWFNFYDFWSTNGGDDGR